MCGLCGILFEKRRRTAKDLHHLLDIFTRLLLLSESRGRHASGIGWIKRDGSCGIFKAALPASELVRQKSYSEALAAMDNKTTILMGHTRWRMKGSETNNDNNHPLVLAPEGSAQDAPTLLLTHNGHIMNADALFRRFRFPRTAEVDSEILLHCAAATAVRATWDVACLRQRLALCQGTMTAIMASAAVPRNILIAKAKKPLSLLYNHRRRVIVYASEMSLLVEALGDTEGWKEIHLPPMTLAIFDYERLVDYREETFRLGRTASLGRWACR